MFNEPRISHACSLGACWWREYLIQTGLTIPRSLRIQGWWAENMILKYLSTGREEALRGSDFSLVTPLKRRVIQGTNWHQALHRKRQWEDTASSEDFVWLVVKYCLSGHGQTRHPFINVKVQEIKLLSSLVTLRTLNGQIISVADRGLGCHLCDRVYYVQECLQPRRDPQLTNTMDRRRSEPVGPHIHRRVDGYNPKWLECTPQHRATVTASHYKALADKLATKSSPRLKPKLLSTFKGNT